MPSVIRISENDAGRSGPDLRFRARVSMWSDQFELRSSLKMIAMVGRTSETSAISMRPINSGKKRRRATTCSAVSAGSPVLAPSITSSKLTALAGNRETETSPRSTGSSPVTARISACTALRTASAGSNHGKITRAAIAAAATTAAANPRRLMPTAAVTTRLSQRSPTKRAGHYPREIEVQTWKLTAEACNRSVTLSWPQPRRAGRVFRCFAKPLRRG